MKKLLFISFVFQNFYVIASQKDNLNKVEQFKKEITAYKNYKSNNFSANQVDDKSWYRLSKKLNVIWESSKVTQKEKEECYDLFNDLLGQKE